MSLVTRGMGSNSLLVTIGLGAKLAKIVKSYLALKSSIFITNLRDTDTIIKEGLEEDIYVS